MTGPTRRAQPHEHPAQPYKLASVLLQYPTMALFEGLDHLDSVVPSCPRATRRPLARFLSWLRASSPNGVAEHYVETFDLRRRCALYLTYHRYGDTRKRGMALLTLKSKYRGAGFHPGEMDLPDYLPLVLDFAALSPTGEGLLRAHRADVELIRRALRRARTPYVDVIDAVCAQLGRPSAGDLRRVRQAWGAGPPREEVGLEPYARPEHLMGPQFPAGKGI
jgi:nitrate reductase delta subunit